MYDLKAIYAPIIATLRRIYADDPSIVAQLDALEVTSEDWDLNGCGGHFKIAFPTEVPPIDEDIVECDALDSDGGLMQILLHTVGDRLNWGEWFKVYPDTRVQVWPPKVLGHATEIAELRRIDKINP